MADKGTTSKDAPVFKHATDAEAAAFDLKPHLVNLMLEEPFYSKVLRTITKVRTQAIPTAGVLAKDGDVKMWWNPNFLAALTTKQVFGLLKHECLHLVFEHTTERRYEPHSVWNWACDLAINSHIPENELPKGGLIPGKAFEPLTEEAKAKMAPEAIARHERLSAKLASLPKKESSEWYFAQLMNDPDIKKDIMENGKATKSLKEALENGDVTMDKDGNLVDKDGNPVSVIPGPLDDHDGWGDMSEEEREFLKGKIKQAANDAAKECDRKGSWGTVGAELRRDIRAALTKEIPWQSILKQFCGLSKRADRSSSRMRLNKKYPGIHSGFKRGYTSSIGVYIDQSGSVGDNELTLLFSELANLAKHTEFTTFHFDTDVDEKSEATWRQGKTPVPHRTRCGGTCFKAPSKHAMRNKGRFDGYLILTDGYAPDPGMSRLRRGWIITPDGAVQDFMKNGRDFVIKMKWPKAKANAA